VPGTDARREEIEQLRESPLDVLIIGGGINGAGVLRDLALRGEYSGSPLRVGLIEKGHFGSGTSGKNSQLIHGGLRYLKYLQFHLVKESLRERSILLKIARQFVQPLQFLLPMYGMRSRLVYGTGLALYDLLAGSDGIARHRAIPVEEVAKIEPGLERDGLSSAALFYDGAVESARFVVENVLDAIAHGGFAANYVRAKAWQRSPAGNWRVECEDLLDGARWELEARKLVDGRGAWMDGDVLRPVRGSHIVLPRVGSSDHAIAHFEPNGRIVFLIPWGDRKQLTLVGTTDEDHQGTPDQVHITPEETEYLLGVARKLFPGHGDVVPISSFSSLRPLVRVERKSAMSVSRDHKIWNSPDGVLHIAGGKYTTYRLMSEEAADLVCRELAPELASVHRTAGTAFPNVERGIGDAMEQHVSDYLFVSTYIGYERNWDALALMPYAQALGNKRGWNDARINDEVSEFVAARPLRPWSA
jgi:glycerol-3-phosphate dehydrogenase